MSEMQALLQKKMTFLVVALLAAAVVGQAAENEANTIQSKQAYVGATVEFDCELRNFYESEIQWRKLVGRMSDESEELSDGRLVIHQLTHEDAGEYECFNPDNGDKRRMRLVVLQANGNGASTQTQAHINPSTTRATHSKPTLQSKYEADVDTNTGESIEIFCEYTNEPNMKWRKVDGSLGAHAIIYGAPNNRLVLNSITEEDEGNYECVLPDGTTSTIYVHVMPDTLKKSNIQQNVFKTNTNDNTDDQLENIITVNAATGSTVKLECELSDYTPGGELSWTKLDGIISYNSRMVDNRLELEDVTADDAGIYECSSENLNTIKFQVIVNNSEVKSDDDAKSTKTTTATTAARTSSETTEQRNEDTYVTRNIGAQLEIVCALRVQAHDSISWTRLDGREIDYSRASSHDNKLVFTSIRPEDAGIYECKSEATRNTHRTRITIMGETFVKEPNATVLQADRRQGQSSPRCQSWQFMCDTFQCIPRWKVCDGNQDCPDGSDEANCTESGRNRDHEGHLRQLQQPEHRQEETETWGCHETEATCRNGECIPKWKLCNGKADCSDGSDEHSCGGSTGIAGQCQPNERPCRTDGKCIPKIWWCDGERECADGSDEESCSGPSSSGMCRSYEFMCKSNNQCVYKSFLCDGERDCADSSDEMGCIEPKVIQTPVREVRVCLGSTFQLECRATGFPVPYINWRLNWGHVCSEPRCCMHSDETGYGILTVTNAKYEDAGAYSCEAFSTKGREFAIPDAIVRVEHCYHQPEFECKPNPCYPCKPVLPVLPNPCYPCYPSTTTTTTTTTRRTTTTTPISCFPCTPQTTTPRTTTPRTTTPLEINEDCSCNGHSDMCTCSNVCYDCQHGTNGTHCESCLPGYTRDPSRPNDPYAWCYKDYIPPPFIRTTTRPPTTTTRYINIDCECYNHSECTCEGKCHRCLHHTKGEQCDECIIGYQGNPKHGTEFDCQPIPGFVCPGNTQGELDGCNECKPGYTGDPRTFNCFPIDGYNAGYQDRVREYHHYVAPTTTTSQPEEDYHPGYYHDSNQQYQHYEEITTTTTSEPEEEQYTDHNFDRFQPFLAATTRSQAVNAECNMFGTSQLLDGTCKCKAGVIGATCDQCAPRFFHLVERKTYKKGCVSCFCNGLEVDCASSNLRYSKLAAKFDENEMWKISDRFIQIQQELEVVDNGIEFKRFDEFNDVEMFFLVPAKFKGQKLNAYGGRLEFNLTVRDQSSPGELKQVEIRLSGAHVNVVHKSETAIEVNRETPISVQLVEDNFKRYGDNGRVDRDHLMMALSEIKIIMIRASYTQKQESIRLSDFTLDVAVENDEKNDDEETSVSAKMVEVCQCPTGYTGNSCENCAEGYVRSRRGFYLGLCEPQL